MNQKEADKLLNDSWKEWIASDFSKESEWKLDNAWNNNKTVFKELKKEQEKLQQKDKNEV